MLVASRSFPRWCWAKLYIPFFSVFLCAGAVLGFMELLIHIKNIFSGTCFSFLFKAASEVLKLIVQLTFIVFFGFVEVTLFSIISNSLFFTMLQWTALDHIKKFRIKWKTESWITLLCLPLGVSLGVLVWSEKKIYLSPAPHFNLWTSLQCHPLWLKGCLRSSQGVFAIITQTIRTLPLYPPCVGSIVVCLQHS